MNQKNKLSTLTLDELKSKKKQATSAALGLGIVMLVAVSYLFYSAITTKNYVLIGVGTSCYICFVPLFISIKMKDYEIKSCDTK